jgi:hypothetical protein
LPSILTAGSSLVQSLGDTAGFAFVSPRRANRR